MTQAGYFSKVVDLNNKITITEYKKVTDNPIINDKNSNPHDGKKVLLIIGGIVGTLMIAMIIRLLLKRKRIKLR